MGKIDMTKCLDLRNIDWSIPISGSSDGILPKSVITKGDQKFYLKLGSYSLPYGFYGIEPIIEVINSRIGKILGVPVLEYTLKRCTVTLNGVVSDTLVSLSKDYKKRKYVGISIEKWYRRFRKGNETPIDTIRRHNLEDSIYKQFVYDYIIMNLDRHGKNTEVLIGNNINTMSIAPFFDNSLTFLTNRPVDELKRKVQFNDSSRVNNFIGSMNLGSNLELIDKNIILRNPSDLDRQELFQGMAAITTRQFRDYIWYTLNRRVENVKSKRIPFIQWR